MYLPNNLSEIRAEVWLNYLYPELEEQWIGDFKGNFYRNYQPDLMELNMDTHMVDLSRDGMIRLIPQGFITTDEELKSGKADFKQIQQRIRLLHDAFLPFDSFYLRGQLRMERQVSSLLEMKLAFVLERYFGYRLQEVSNTYLKEALYMLPYVSTWKGDLTRIKQLLSTLLERKVIMRRGRYSSDDTAYGFIPAVYYYILAPELTASSFAALQKEIEPLVAFIKEWFIPFEVHAEILLKENPTDEVRLGQRMLMHYNAFL
jgi:hypothetical protein